MSGYTAKEMAKNKLSKSELSKSAEKNFGRLPEKYCSYENSRIAIVPVPYDGTSTWIKGADNGPDAIIEASENMELYDIETDSVVCEQGIFTDSAVKENSSPESMAKAVEKRVKKHLDAGKFVVVLGGEHSVTIGSVRAHADKCKGNADKYKGNTDKEDKNKKDKDKSICVLQLDAHSDTRPEYEGSKYNHACVMSRVKELCPIVQVGIRSMDAEEKEFIDKKRMFFAHQIVNDRNKDRKWIKKVVSQLSENVYVTIDLDVFDSSLMPSTGTPEPGGLFWYDVVELLKEVAAKRNIIGFDVVELCPNKNNRAPDFLAAKLVYTLLSRKFYNTRR